ncbi:UDP-3-O-acyl-N-acetylglucosamine deacetylase, partial [Methylobacterium radiotolerans]|uniref:UDP-3-O-acyl-N-acetylglucosamine deacetylase n=1 Tax=Methylobacterium radiotolerans TaxID=31998 RepID=UPI0015C5D1F2
GRYRKAMELSHATYGREIAAARTCVVKRDVERCWRAGFTICAALGNHIAIGETSVVNPSARRVRDAVVRPQHPHTIGDPDPHPAPNTYHTTAAREVRNDV